MLTHVPTCTHTHKSCFILLKILDDKSLQHSEIDEYIQDDTGNINGAYDESEKRDSVRERQS